MTRAASLYCGVTNMTRKNRLTKKQVRKAIARQEKFLEAFTTGKGRSNPQVVEMANHTRGTLDALYAILEAMNGSLVCLSILSEEL